jgi:hypothetical protein
MSFKKALEFGGATVLGAYLACCGGNKLVLPEKNPVMLNQKMDLSDVPGMNRVRMSIDFPRADNIFIGTLSNGEIEYNPVASGYLSTRYTFSSVECAKFKKTQLTRFGKLETIIGSSEIKVLMPGVVDSSFYYLGALMDGKVEVINSIVKDLDKTGGKLNVRITDMGTKKGEKYIIFTKDNGTETYLSNIYPATDTNVDLLERMLWNFNYGK